MVERQRPEETPESDAQAQDFNDEELSEIAGGAPPSEQEPFASGI